MSLSAVLFDLDDTLHDKSATLRALARRQFASARLAQLGIAAASWEASFVAFNNERIEKAEVFNRLAIAFRLDAGVRETLLRDFDASTGDVAQPIPGAVELVRGCKALGLKVGLVTNGRDAYQRGKVAGLGLLDDFDAIITSGALGVKKPDHAIFRACLDALSIPASQAAFVGDDLAADVTPASELGMLAIWKNAAPDKRFAYVSDSLFDIHAFIRVLA